MILFIFLIALAVPSFAQDENSEDAFAMPQNEGMEGFMMSTAMLDPVVVTTKAPPTVDKPQGLPDEAMAEDPFEMKDTRFSSIDANAVPTTTTLAPVAPIVSENEDRKTTEALEEEKKTRTELSKEEEQPIPSTATVWTASTEVARETTERRVLKEKSGETKEEKKEESTTAKMEESTTARATEDSEETPFDSHQLSGLFEADGSPKVEEGPEFPILQLPEEHSAEILGNEDPRPVAVTSETTTEGISTTIALAPMMEETTTTIETTTAAETSAVPSTTAMVAVDRTNEVTTTTTHMEDITTTTTAKAEEATTMSTTVLAPVMREEPAHRPLSPNILTPITVKITSIEWMNDFANATSGKYKKLVEQIVPELNQHLREVFEDDFISFEIESLSKGSVVVNGFVSLKAPVSDAEQAASRFEALLSAAGSRLGGNTVDPTSVTVNGAPSRAYLDRVNASYSPASASPLLIAVVGVAVVLFIVLITCICLATNRRSHGGVKLGLKRPDEGNVRMGGVPSINLMSYAGSSAVSPSSRSTMMPRQEEREVV